MVYFLRLSVPLTFCLSICMFISHIKGAQIVSKVVFYSSYYFMMTLVRANFRICAYFFSSQKNLFHFHITYCHLRKRMIGTIVFTYSAFFMILKCRRQYCIESF